MANTNAPFGLEPFGALRDGDCHFYRITNNYGTPLYINDPVKIVAAGTIERALVTGAISAIGSIVAIFQQYGPKTLRPENLAAGLAAGAHDRSRSPGRCSRFSADTRRGDANRLCQYRWLVPGGNDRLWFSAAESWHRFFDGVAAQAGDHTLTTTLSESKTLRPCAEQVECSRPYYLIGNRCRQDSCPLSGWF